MDNDSLMELTADIVSAQVGHNKVDAVDVPRLIQSVFTALAGAGQAAPAEEKLLEPKVPVRASVKPDVIACLECGARLRMLKRHLAADHGLTPADYRTRWSLPANYPMVAPNYSAKRAQMAKSIGLGRKAGTNVSGKAAEATTTVANGK